MQLEFFDVLFAIFFLFLFFFSFPWMWVLVCLMTLFDSVDPACVLYYTGFFPFMKFYSLMFLDCQYCCNFGYFKNWEELVLYCIVLHVQLVVVRLEDRKKLDEKSLYGRLCSFSNLYRLLNWFFEKDFWGSSRDSPRV